MDKKFFCVAGHAFAVEADEKILSQMENYAPFVVNPDKAGNVVFSLVVQNAAAPEYTEETRQEDEGQSIICGRTAEGEPVFDFCLHEKSTGVLVSSKDYKDAHLFLNPENGAFSFALNNSLMVMYALSTATLETALFHAAAVRYKERGYLFLGKSGTGKSTHARLWLKYNEGAELFNDDNPVVRLFKSDNGKMFAKAYGSPWSGKTSCYKNVGVRLGGLVFLSQAPFNKISPLSGVSAYAALLPSISGMRWDKKIADGLHRTQNELAANVHVWHLECLPDEAAAKLCCKSVACQTIQKDDSLILAEAVRLIGEGVSVTFPVNGRSMLPFIVGGRDSVILEKPKFLQVGDVVLACVTERNDEKSYVVHRIVSLENDLVTLMGDGNLALRERCRHSDVCAKVVCVVGPKGKRYLPGTLRYRMAAKIWYILLPARRYLLWIYRRVNGEN